MKIGTSSRSRKVVREMQPEDFGLPPIPLEKLRLKRILVPVDFSDCSHKALHYAVHFARQFGAELTLLHVIVLLPPPPPMVIPPSDYQLTTEYREQFVKRLAGWQKEVVPEVSATAVIRNGTSAHWEIIDAARESDSDLIIIGNHGRTGLSRILLGATAERVVRHAPCPVLVIRKNEHEFIEPLATEAGVEHASAA